MLAMYLRSAGLHLAHQSVVSAGADRHATVHAVRSERRRHGVVVWLRMRGTSMKGQESRILPRGVNAI